MASQEIVQATPSALPLHGEGALHHTIIVGAGPAGLAVAACLRQKGIPFIILEQAEQVGSAWHGHYDRLHLHTAKQFSGLPFLPFPRDYPRYPSREQVISYLEMYARHFELEPRFGRRVTSARYVDGMWDVQTEDEYYLAENLVIATGYSQEPNVPQWPGQSSFRGPIIHSSRYRNGAAFKGQKVLVVGFGNSGGEIAIDLWERGSRPSIAVRSRVNVIPRDLFGIPILALSILQRKLPPRVADALNAPILRMTIGDLRPYGLNPSPAGPITQIRTEGRIPLIDVGTIRLIKQGHITIYPGLQGFTEEGVLFSDGQEVKFDAVILATGYRPRVNNFLEGGSGVYDREGAPLSSGKEEVIPGLYFCGFYVSPTGMLREIALEAQRISEAIARSPSRSPTYGRQ